MHLRAVLAVLALYVPVRLCTRLLDLECIGIDNQLSCRGVGCTTGGGGQDVSDVHQMSPGSWQRGTWLVCGSRQMHQHRSLAACCHCVEHLMSGFQLGPVCLAPLPPREGPGQCPAVWLSSRDPTQCTVLPLLVQALGFDVVELSTGFISLPLRDWLNLVDDVRDAGLKVRVYTRDLDVLWVGRGGTTPFILG